MYPPHEAILGRFQGDFSDILTKSDVFIMKHRGRAAPTQLSDIELEDLFNAVDTSGY